MTKKISAEKKNLMRIDQISKCPERVVLKFLEDPRDALRHIARYRFCIPFCGRRILDVGCGTGYGLKILKKAKSPLDLIVGIDKSIEALKFLKNDLDDPEVNIVCTDAHKLPFRANIFDTIIALEVLEHLEHPASFLGEVHRTMPKSGKVIISTPNKITSSPISRVPFNPYHRNEWYLQGFLDFLNAFLPISRIYGQQAKNWASVLVLAFWQATVIILPKILSINFTLIFRELFKKFFKKHLVSNCSHKAVKNIVPVPLDSFSWLHIPLTFLSVSTMLNNNSYLQLSHSKNDTNVRARFQE